MSSTQKPAREPLSRDVIIDSAINLADTDGLDAVTIRRVAADNGVTPMALYWHFRDKGELLDAIAERIFADVRIPDTDDLEWAQALAAVLSAFLAAMRPHPNTAVLVLTRVFASEPGLVLAERVLDLLVCRILGRPGIPDRRLRAQHVGHAGHDGVRCRARAVS